MNATNSMPPDRGHLSTEQRHEGSQDLDALDTLACVKLMVEDHGRVQEALDAASRGLAAFIDALVEKMRDGGRLIYLGAGTSGRLGVLDASECPPTFQSDPGQIVGLIAGGDSALRKSSESMEDDPEGANEELDSLEVGSKDTVLGIAAGGTTPYVLGGIKIAKTRGAMTGLLTCAPQASPPEACDHLLLLDTGPELLTGSTRLKAGSATKLALNIITTTTFTRLGKVYGNLMVDLRATNDKLSDRAIRIFIELFPETTREESHEWLAQAHGALKLALVMKKLGVDRNEAERRLQNNHGQLRSILGANS
ncbi:MAG: N-acetylmuramic acid 6-phosphate etherase [Planctomycetota bacterium]|nr:N-acetylmuramic acid 6-phosphate etherase [Planctomycetota bacterium]